MVDLKCFKERTLQRASKIRALILHHYLLPSRGVFQMERCSARKEWSRYASNFSLSLILLVTEWGISLSWSPRTSFQELISVTSWVWTWRWARVGRCLKRDFQVSFLHFPSSGGSTEETIIHPWVYISFMSAQYLCLHGVRHALLSQIFSWFGWWFRCWGCSSAGFQTRSIPLHESEQHKTASHCNYSNSRNMKFQLLTQNGYKSAAIALAVMSLERRDCVIVTVHTEMVPGAVMPSSSSSHFMTFP